MYCGQMMKLFKSIQYRVYAIQFSEHISYISSNFAMSRLLAAVKEVLDLNEAQASGLAALPKVINDVT